MGVIPKYDIYEITYYTIGDNKSLAYVKYNNIEGWISFSSKEALLEHDCQKECPLYDREVLEKEITVLNNETKEEHYHQEQQYIKLTMENISIIKDYILLLKKQLMKK